MVGKSGLAILYHLYKIPQISYEDGDNFPFISRLSASFLYNIILIYNFLLSYSVAEVAPWSTVFFLFQNWKIDQQLALLPKYVEFYVKALTT